MKRRYLIRSLIILTIIVSVLSIIGYHFFFSMNALPKGELLSTTISPDSKYVLNLYLYSGNATVSYAVRGEVIENITGKKRNIYWEYKIDHADIFWESKEVVNINGHSIDIVKGKYDFRNR